MLELIKIRFDYLMHQTFLKLLHTCAPIFELSFNISTMAYTMLDVESIRNMFTILYCQCLAEKGTSEKQDPNPTVCPISLIQFA